ncbi:MAG: YdcF family protein [Desulfococcaceae bacterium]
MTEILMKQDVIIVMGAGVRKHGKASPALRRRVLYGIRLFRQGKADYLLFTGGIGKYPPAEAVVMRELAVAEGVMQERIFTEEKADSTFTSAALCAKMMGEHHWKSALIVSDSFHILRSVFIFRCFGIRAEGNGTKEGRISLGPFLWWLWHVRELIAVLWYWILWMSVRRKLKHGIKIV